MNDASPFTNNVIWTASMSSLARATQVSSGTKRVGGALGNATPVYGAWTSRRTIRVALVPSALEPLPDLLEETRDELVAAHDVLLVARASLADRHGAGGRLALTDDRHVGHLERLGLADTVRKRLAVDELRTHAGGLQLSHQLGAARAPPLGYREHPHLLRCQPERERAREV